MHKAWMLGLCLFVAGLLCLNPPTRAQLTMTGVGPAGSVTAAGASIAFVAGTNAASTDTNSVTTSAIDTSGANFLVLEVSDLVFTGAGMVSDNKSNTWTPRTSVDGAFCRTRLYYSPSATVGSGHTFTLTGTSNFPAIGVAAFSNVNATPYDVENGAVGNSTSPAAGSITPSQNNEVVIAGLCTRDAASAIGSGFNLVGTPLASGANSLGNGLAYIVQTSAGAVNPTWTTGSNGWAATIASFKN